MAKLQPLLRPPRDMAHPILHIANGCTWGTCRFCSIYDDFPFEVFPTETVVARIEELAAQATCMTKRLYLAGGNPFGLPTEHLLRVFDEVEKRIPQVKSYGGFCRVADVARKSDDELAALAARGVSNLAIGAESGHDPTLAFIRKGHTAADVAEQGQRLHAAGIDFTYYYLAGMAGAGKGQENAVASGEAFSAAAPNTILIVTLSPTKGWPLADDIAAGRWEPESEIEVAREIRTFIEHLNCKTSLDCSHDSDVIRFSGVLPADKEKMLQLMDYYLPKINERAAGLMRTMIHHASFAPTAASD